MSEPSDTATRESASRQKASGSAFVGVLTWAALAVSAIPFALFLVIAAGRVSYPFDIEWMEGALLGHGVELLETGHIYKLPSQDFIPFIYPPLYTYLTALGIRLFGLGYEFSRVLSILSTVASAALVALIVWREVRRRALAGLAFLTPFAMCGVTGYWFDLVRVDAVTLLLVIGAVYAYLYVTPRFGANLCAGAGLLALAAFGKQSLALFAVALAVHLVLDRRWRALAVFAASSVVAHGLLWGALVGSEGRLAWTYVFDVPRTHGWWETTALAAYVQALRGLIGFQPVLVVASVALFVGAWTVRPEGEGRRLRLSGLMAITAVLVGLTTRAKWGGYENAFIPAYYFLALVCFHAAGRMALALGRAGPPSEGAGSVAGEAPAGSALWVVFLVAILLGNGSSALGIDLAGQRVGRDRRVAARQLAALVNAVDGRVLIPSRNAAAVTGRFDQNHYHTMAARDLSDYPDLFDVFQRNNEGGFRSAKFRAVVMDIPVPSLQTLFGFRATPLDSLGIRSEHLASMTGRQTCPRYPYYLPGVNVEELRRAVARAGLGDGVD